MLSTDSFFQQIFIKVLNTHLQVLGTGDKGLQLSYIVGNLRAGDQQLANEKPDGKTLVWTPSLRHFFKLICMLVHMSVHTRCTLTHICTNITDHIYVCTNQGWLLLLHPHFPVAGLICSWSTLPSRCISGTAFPSHHILFPKLSSKSTVHSKHETHFLTFSFLFQQIVFAPWIKNL